MVALGDKTQLATVALGARFGSPVMVTAGTTLGMLAADGLAIFAGTYTAAKLSMARNLFVGQERNCPYNIG